ncbi:MAG TPA: methyl-accepting chemotaxis protein [Magnetospirillaceae bacterium]|nr:methyl-accepting chemotaxis protein [Magnetospirillaceae bacterium]
MISGWTFGRRLAAGFGLACFVLLLIAGLGDRNAASLVETEGWLTHTYQVRTRLADLLAGLVAAESAERGYLLTGNDAYLEGFRGSLDAIKSAGDDVRHLTTDNPSQQRRLAELQPMIDQRVATLRDTIEMRRTQGLEPSAKLVQSNGSLVLMTRLKGMIAEADQEENDLLRVRTEQAAEASRSTIAIIRWGGGGGILAVALIGWLITVSLGREIGAAVAHVESSSAELQAAANQQASSATEQASAMTEVSTTINELLASSRQIADSAQRVAGSSEQTAQAATGGQSMVDRTSDSIGAIRRQMEQIVSHMLELGKKSQEIGAVLDIVSELAEQTNILAINATIEAAGAGESGKRFAVVADEIRKLADRVGGSTKEIRGLIDEVRGAVNTTVMATETGSKAVESGARQFLDLSAAFKQIAALVNSTSDAAREIGLSTKQQASAVDQVNVAISDVTQSARETETSASQTLQTASQLSTLARGLLRLIRPTKA